MRRGVVRACSIALIVTLGGWLLFESPLFDSPERHVVRYLDATARGEAVPALTQWDVFSGGPYGLRVPDALMTRRQALTRALAADHAGRDFTITSIEWWRTCCTPDRIDDPDNAGLARVHVAARGDSGTTYRLVFEIWVKDLTWWGDAKGEWLHDWRLYEIHTEDEPCVFPNPAYGCIRSFG